MENKNKQIKLMVSEKEFEQIKSNAAACGKNTSAFLREVALNLCVINTDTTCITEHTSEISSYRNAINQLVFTIKKTGKYTPADLEYIIEKTNLLLKSEKEFLANYNKSLQSEKKTVARIVRQVIKKELTNNAKTK